MIQGKRVNEEKVNQIISSIYNLIPQEEKIRGIFSVSQVLPIISNLVVTDSRILWTKPNKDRYGSSIFAKEILASDIQSVELKKGNEGLLSSLLYTGKLTIQGQDTELTLDIFSKESNEIAKLLNSIKGSDTVESILTKQAIELGKQQKIAAQERKEAIKNIAKNIATPSASQKTVVKNFYGLGRGVAERKAQRYARRHNMRIVSMTSTYHTSISVVFESL